MTSPSIQTVNVQGNSTRVFRAGAGKPLVFLAGIGGLPRWTPFLAELAQSRQVVAPSLPGFPGAEAFRHLDSLYDWVIATIETLEALQLDEPPDVVASSVSTPLAAEVAAVAGHLLRRLVLIGPMGVTGPSPDEMITDLWAMPPGIDNLAKLVCAEPSNYKSLWEPADTDALELQIVQTRAMEASARYLFPFAETGLGRRLRRIDNPTLLIRGTLDRVVPEASVRKFARGLSAVSIAAITDAGHLVELDQPESAARAITAFVSS